jgi:hypothetical protein
MEFYIRGFICSRYLVNWYQIQSEEEELLQLQVELTQSGFQARKWIEILGTFLTFIVLIVVYALLYHQMTKRQQAEIR